MKEQDHSSPLLDVYWSLAGSTDAVRMDLRSPLQVVLRLGLAEVLVSLQGIGVGMVFGGYLSLVALLVAVTTESMTTKSRTGLQPVGGGDDLRRQRCA